MSGEQPGPAARAVGGALGLAGAVLDKGVDAVLRRTTGLVSAGADQVDQAALRLERSLRKATVGTAPPPSPTPRTQVWSRDEARLFRYRGHDEPVDLSNRTEPRPPVLFVMSLVTTSLVFDLQRGNSVLEHFLDAGFDVYMLDWGVPGPVDAGNTLETYCDEYLPRAVEAVIATSGAEETAIFGYCLGAVLTLLSVAGHPRMPVSALVLLATPVDMTCLGPLTSSLADRQVTAPELEDWTGNVPADTVDQGFRLLSPTGEVTTWLSLWNSLPDADRLAAHDALTRWSTTHVPFPGAAFAQMTDLFILDDALVRGQVPLGGRVVDLADVRGPALVLTGERDDLVPKASSDPLRLPGADVEEMVLPAGHAGILVGRTAHRTHLPRVSGWLSEHT